MSRAYSIYSPGASAPDLVLACDPIDSDHACEVLSNGEITIIGQLANSSNGALLGSIVVGDDREITCVIKPAMYENPLVDFEWGSLAKREVASYELSHLLGWDIVPPTVLRDVQDMQSSVQLFIPHDPRQHYFTIAPQRHSEMEPFIVFDYIANNADRKAGHMLAEEPHSFDLFLEAESEALSSETSPAPSATGSRSEASAFAGQDDVDGDHGIKKLWGIDHGLTFHVDDKLRTVMWEFAEEPISNKLMGDIQQAIPRVEEVLSPYISGYEIEATVIRIEKMFVNPYHRALDPTQRAFPWPLV